MIRLLSYIYPITKTIKSKHNNVLEITWFRGKKLLNTKNANYSNGSLKKILKIGLKHTNIELTNNILLLGLGGGSAIEILVNKYNYDKKITAIEIDPVIIDIAEKEYNIKSNKNLTIICKDAYGFIKENTIFFDFIIVDLFLDDEIPTQFFQEQFWLKIINTKQILFNASLKGNYNTQLQNIITLLNSKKFTTQVLHKVNKTNTLIIAKKQ